MIVAADLSILLDDLFGGLCYLFVGLWQQAVCHVETLNLLLLVLEPTIPVNMTAYLNGLKRRYFALQKGHPEQQFKIQLIASYLDHFTKVQESKNITTKQHLLIVKVPIKDKSVKSLNIAVTHLDEKIEQVKRDIENALTDFDVTAKVLTSQEVQEILKNLINFNG